MTIDLAPAAILNSETLDGKPHREWLAVTFAQPAEDAAREITGLFVPYDVEIDRRNWLLGTARLRIGAGSLTMRDDAKAFYGHDWTDNGMPIGRPIASSSSAAGMEGTLKLSKTAKATEVYELCLDGTLNKFSIGFEISEYLVEDADSDAPILVVTAGEVFEVSIVPFPAYDDAAVGSVLSLQTKEKRMTVDIVTPPAAPDTLSADAGRELLSSLDALSTEVTNLGARVATLGTPAGPAASPVPFDSYGEYVQAMAAGDPDALELFLAYSGGTTGDFGSFMQDGWVGDITAWVDKGRKVFGLVDSGVLPPTGMGVEYGKILADTTAVAKQVAEGDALAYGKITWTTATAPLSTYGGYGEASRQQVERSSVNVVETYFKALALRYAQVTEAAVRTAITGATGKSITGIGGTVPATSDKWIDFLVDGALWLDDKAMTPDFLLVSGDVFKGLAKLRDGVANDAPRLMDRQSGAIDIVGLTGDLYNIPVVPISGTGVVRLCNSFAVKTFESGGAPLRLADEDITKLTKAFSVYGYLATAVQDNDAIVKPAT